MRFQADPGELAQAKEEYREKAQARIEDTVEAAWQFSRAGFGPSYAASKVSPLAGTVLRTINKKRAAGFPTSFALALTPTKVYAFQTKYKGRSRKYELKDELAVWDRSGLQVSTKDTTIHTEVTIESPGEGEKVVCATGKDEVSRDFVRRLEAPVAAA